MESLGCSQSLYVVTDKVIWSELELGFVIHTYKQCIEGICLYN